MAQWVKAKWVLHPGGKEVLSPRLVQNSSKSKRNLALTSFAPLLRMDLKFPSENEAGSHIMRDFLGVLAGTYPTKAMFFSNFLSSSRLAGAPVSAWSFSWCLGSRASPLVGAPWQPSSKARSSAGSKKLAACVCCQGLQFTICCQLGLDLAAQIRSRFQSCHHPVVAHLLVDLVGLLEQPCCLVTWALIFDWGHGGPPDGNQRLLRGTLRDWEQWLRCLLSQVAKPTQSECDKHPMDRFTNATQLPCLTILGSQLHTTWAWTQHHWSLLQA